MFESLPDTQLQKLSYNKMIIFSFFKKASICMQLHYAMNRHLPPDVLHCYCFDLYVYEENSQKKYVTKNKYLMDI